MLRFILRDERSFRFSTTIRIVMAGFTNQKSCSFTCNANRRRRSSRVTSALYKAKGIIAFFHACARIREARKHKRCRVHIWYAEDSKISKPKVTSIMVTCCPLKSYEYKPESVHGTTCNYNTYYFIFRSTSAGQIRRIYMHVCICNVPVPRYNGQFEVI
jgi:hypothetical protein